MSQALDLRNVLKHLDNKELEEFKWYLQNDEVAKAAGVSAMARSDLEGADRKQVAEVMVQTYQEDYKELARKILKRMNRNDLVNRLC